MGLGLDNASCRGRSRVAVAAFALFLGASGLAVAGGSAGADDVGAEVEPFARRACKFRPLPRELSEGFQGPDGSVHISDVYGVPSVALARGGHELIAALPAGGAHLGVSIQVPFASSVLVFFTVTSEAGETRRCRHTWGAGGRLKQCSLQWRGIQGGRLTLRLRAAGVGDAAAPAEGLANPAACVSIRVDLELSVAPPDLQAACGEASWFGGQSAHVNLKEIAPVNGAYETASRAITAVVGAGGVVWSSPVPRSSDSSSTQLTFLSASTSFASAMLPVQLLLEEVAPGASMQGDRPTCSLRCVGGTPVAYGQSLRQGLPLGPAYRLWLLAPPELSGQCVEFDYSFQMYSFETGKLDAFYVGPPPWLCEGAAWPRRLEQTGGAPAIGVPSWLGGNSGAAVDDGVLRASSFVLDDVFELTKPPQDRCTGTGCSKQVPGGLHAIELVVSQTSVLRLAVSAATVATRPALLPGDASSAWRRLAIGNLVSPTAEVPAAGGEPRHAIHAELQPGTYTIVFVTEFALGGLRPCASIRLRLRLNPREFGGRLPPGVQSGACPGEELLDLGSLAARASQGMANTATYQLTLPRPTPSTDGDVEILARAPLDVGQSSLASALVKASVTSPFAEADLHIQIYADDVPLGELQPGRDGDGYQIVVGPLSADARFRVVLFHVPRRPGGTSPPVCVSFSVSLSITSAAPPPVALSMALPGFAVCDAAAPPLPSELRLPPRGHAVLEGEFLLPESGEHTIQVVDTFGSTPVLVRAVVASADAEVGLQGGIGGSLQARYAGLAEDAWFEQAIPKSLAEAWIEGSAGLVTRLKLATARLPTTAVCPSFRLHIVAARSEEVTFCTQGAPDVDDQRRSLSLALAQQPATTAVLQELALSLEAARTDLEVPFSVTAMSAELRLELGLAPLWLPVEAIVLRRAAGAAVGRKQWAFARSTGHRLVLLAANLPRGDYTLRLRSWAGDRGGWAAPASLCARVSILVALVTPAGHDTSNFRQEMLNHAELLASIPLPPCLSPSWLKPNVRYVSSQMYILPPQGITTSIIAPQPMWMRVIAEPANILTPTVTLEVKFGAEVIVYPTSLASSSAFALDRLGTYSLVLMPGTCAGCEALSRPFFFTIGIGPQASPAAAAASGLLCDSHAPQIEALRPPAGGPHSWRKAVSLRSQNVPVTTVQLTVALPSVVLLSAWSPFVDRYIRVGFHAEEGIWVGEQRLRQSALEIELPPGDYKVQLQEMSAVGRTFGGCIDFGLSVSVAAFTPPAEKSAVAGQQRLGVGGSGPGASGAWALSLGARCEGLGATAMPLDFLSPEGGSASLGGPTDAAGRILVRKRLLLSDIHDGRRKLFLNARADSILRVAIVSGDAPILEMAPETATHQAITPDLVWSHGSGWSFTKRFDSASAGGVWLSFHREHRDPLLSGCAAFELLVQTAPIGDLAAMTACPQGSSKVEPHDWVARALVSGVSNIPSILHVDASRASFETVFTISLETFSLLEVEVQFNFLLSNVDLQLSAGASQPLRAVLGALSDASSPLNTHAVLQLRLPAGSYQVSLSHETSGWPLPASAGSGLCLPLRLLARHAPWSAEGVASAVAVSPSLSEVVSVGSDVVLTAISPSIGKLVPQLGGMAPTGVARYAGGVVAVWDYDAVTAMVANRQGRDSGNGLWALPLSFDAVAGVMRPLGNVMVAIDSRPRPPWAGGAWPESLPLDRWTMESALVASAPPVGWRPATQPPQAPEAPQPPASTHVVSSITSSSAVTPPSLAHAGRGSLYPPPAEEAPAPAAGVLWWLAALMVCFVGVRNKEALARFAVPLAEATRDMAARAAPGQRAAAFGFPTRGKEMPSMVEVTQWASWGESGGATRRVSQADYGQYGSF